MVLETEPILMVIVEVPTARPAILKPLYFVPETFVTLATPGLEELTEKSSSGRISFSTKSSIVIPLFFFEK